MLKRYKEICTDEQATPEAKFWVYPVNLEDVSNEKVSLHVF